MKILSFSVAARQFALFSCCVLNTVIASADNISVAVATNFLAPMNAVAKEFSKNTGHQILLSAGSSGKLYVQIQNGAPFEVLLSADTEIPAQLEQEGLAVAGSRFTYATGALVLWSADPSLIDAKGQILWKNNFAKLAVADPKLAPYGKAAIDALTAWGRLESVRGKFVTGENIAQTYQFVASGNAELGFVAMSQVMKNGQLIPGSVWVVPETLYTSIRQEAVLLNTGKNNAAARLLMGYLKTDKAKGIMKSFGYRF